jgi:hypothetical protein
MPAALTTESFKVGERVRIIGVLRSAFFRVVSVHIGNK